MSLAAPSRRAKARLAARPPAALTCVAGGPVMERALGGGARPARGQLLGRASAPNHRRREGQGLRRLRGACAARRGARAALTDPRRSAWRRA